MRPLDPRLLRYARSTRGFLILATVLGILTALLVIAQARALSSAIVDVTSNGMTLAAVGSTIAALAAIIALRAILASLIEVAAFRSAAAVKEELRSAAVEQVIALGPLGPAGIRPAEITTLVTRGVDALDTYFSRYLPQVVLAVIVPLTILMTLLGQDLLSTVIVAVTIPLIPVFMILIGLFTKSRVDRQWKTLAMLSGHFLDLVAGLPTLVILGRAKSQAEAIRAVGERYRSSTMGVLRISFLSSLALELLATISVALVAVSVGLRLAEGQIAYSAALFILLLAPEAYLPLRLVGQHFHAAAEGLGAAGQLFELLETPLPVHGTTAVPVDTTIRIDALTVTYPDRDTPALHPTSFTASPGTVTAIVGRSGAGKSTLLSTLLGFIDPTSGSVTVGDVPLPDVDPHAWQAAVSWVPQSPRLISADLESAPTIAEVVRLGAPQARDQQVREALEAAGLREVIAALPDGINHALAADGRGLSVGQLQRISLARALVRDPRILLLDEPSAALDADSEQAVVDALRAAADCGAVVIVIAHRPAVLAIADQLVRIGSPAEVIA